MAVYTFHVPQEAAPGDRAALERAVVVRDGFSWGALIFQFLWCLWNRLWLVALGFLTLSLALSFALQWAGMPEAVVAGVGALLALLLAFEGNNLRRLTLEWRGLALRGVVVADNVLEAERRAFSIWLNEQPAEGRSAEKMLQPPPRTSTAPSQTPDILGLFPPAGEAH